MRCVPARDGWQLQRQLEGEWVGIPAVVENSDCEWWTFRVAPVEAVAVRLPVTKYSSARVAVSGLEVCAGPPPRPALRRAPLSQVGPARWGRAGEGRGMRTGVAVDVAQCPIPNPGVPALLEQAATATAVLTLRPLYLCSRGYVKTDEVSMCPRDTRPTPGVHVLTPT